jgi:hypothetical protein
VRATIGRNLITTLRQRELDSVGRRVAEETGWAHLPVEAGEPDLGGLRLISPWVESERVTSSGIR